MGYFEYTILYEVVSTAFIVAICIAVYGIKTEIETMVKKLENLAGSINAQSGNKSIEDEIRTITADWKYCKKCGAKEKYSSQFCGKCGEKF